MNSKYGNREKEVLEVVQIARSGAVMSAQSRLEGLNIKAIDKLSEIPDDKYYEDFGDDRPLWRDIVDLEAAKFIGIESSKWGKSYPYDRSVLNTINEDLVRLYSCSFPNEYIECNLHYDIAALINDIVHCRLVMGRTHPFFEMLFAVIRSGGYPCGWEGNYPEGTLIVFYPSSNRKGF